MRKRRMTKAEQAVLDAARGYAAAVRARDDALTVAHREGRSSGWSLTSEAVMLQAVITSTQVAVLCAAKKIPRPKAAP